MAEDLKIAWYNVENLFEPGQHPEHGAAWTEARYRRKVRNVASVVAELFGSDGGPDLLGVCEIASDRVLRDLVAALPDPAAYGIVHHDSPDMRLIDVGFLYRRDRLSVAAVEAFNIRKRYPTRDILHVTCRVDGRATLHVLGNHWPSRSGGQYASEPYRILVAETCSWIVDRLYQADADANILVVGDLNDEPFNRAVQEYLFGIRNRARVTARRNSRTARPYLYNCVWPLLAGPTPGTFYYGSSPSGWNLLDQILVSKALLAGRAGLEVDEDSTAIHRPSRIRSGSKPKPFRKQRHGWIEGFSDHFPVTVRIAVS